MPTYKDKGSLYSAVSSRLDRSKRCTLFALPDRTVHSDTNSVSPGSILARQQLRANTKSLTFPPLYSQVLIYTAESTGASMERTKMPNLRNGSKGDSNPGSLDCESDVLPLSSMYTDLEPATFFLSWHNYKYQLQMEQSC